jgi:RHS repeat-associated protein
MISPHASSRSRFASLLHYRRSCSVGRQFVSLILIFAVLSSNFPLLASARNRTVADTTRSRRTSSAETSSSATSPSGSNFKYPEAVQESQQGIAPRKKGATKPIIAVPVVSSLSPDSTVLGGAAFTLTVKGSNFVNGSVIYWNNIARATKFVSPSQLTTDIQEKDIAVVGVATIKIRVSNPSPVGVSSNALPFVVGQILLKPAPLARDRETNELIGTINVTNRQVFAANVQLTKATLRNLATGATANGTPIPQSLGEMNAGVSANAALRFDGSAGGAGADFLLSVSGSYTGGPTGGGIFNGSFRLKAPPQSSRVYTTDADFSEGSLINVVHSVADQLQLDDKTRAFNFIWVAASTKGTIVKIDTETGAVLGEYRTAPQGQQTNPSRTTVDHNGNVWTANRDGNSVVRIGLLENGQCIDRNGNGRIDTSNALGDLRAWSNAGEVDTDGGVDTAVDECIINYVRVSSFGTRHVSVTTDNDVWVSGTGGQRFDLIDGKTGLIKRSESSVSYGGYGGLIDPSGVIWSANPLLRWDTSKPLTGANGGNWRGYGHDSYGLCIDSHGNVWNTQFSSNTVHKFAPDGTSLGSFHHGAFNAQGCVVGRNDDVWIAHSLNDSSVGHLKNDGTFIGNVNVGLGPTGVAVDARGKIWSTNYFSADVSRIDPNAGPLGADGVTRVGAVDFTTGNLGGLLYNYSDMTGSTLTGAPAEGTWTTIYDSGIAGAAWGRIGWTASLCGDGALSLTVASSEDGTNFGQPETVTSDAELSVVNGRYLKINVSFRRATSGESPVLYDLSVGTQGFTLPAQVNSAPNVNAGADQTIAFPATATLHGSVCDDALPAGTPLAISWEKVSGPGSVSFSNVNSVNPTVTFSAAGLYVLRLTGSDAASTMSDEVTIVVTEGNQPPTVNAGADQTITLPDAANLNGTIFDDGLPTGSTLTSSWSKVSGPGTVNFANPNVTVTTASFTSAGTYVLRLSASDSQLNSSDDVTMTVLDPATPNKPPVVDAGSDQAITLPNVANLNGTVSDDGLPVGSTVNTSWSKVSGPGAVIFGNPNVTVTTAAFSATGTYVLRLTASDSQLTGSDELTVTVNQTNQPPVVNAGADQLIAFGETASLSGTATDDGLPAGGTLSTSWAKVSGPGTVNFGNASQPATTATFSAGGRYVLRLAANDSQSTTSDDLTVTVNQSPTVNAGPDQIITLPDTATLSYTVSDDGLPTGSTNIIWTKVSGPGTVTFASVNGSTTTATFGASGVYVLRLFADDTHLNAADEVTVTVNPAEQAPAVAINSPADESTLTARADVIGSVSGGAWKLEYSLTADEGAPTQWTTFATGVGAVSNARLGTFDPTLLLNGRYLIRLSATGGGQTAFDSVSVVVSEEQKVGNFTISFNDLSVPVAGLPIEVVRTYDSRDKRPGDFGIGWTLGIRNVRVQESRAMGAKWLGTVSPGFVPTYCITPARPHVVTITLAESRVYKFEAVPGPGNGCQLGAPLQEVEINFRPLPGTNASLTVVGAEPLFVPGPFPGAFDLLDGNTVAAADYDQYQLTLEDGTRLVIDQHTGLQSMTDTNGNTLNINSGGIIHSSGKSIAFTRDALGRITQITDPAGHAMTYTYDANGDLLNFKDRENNVTAFTYNSTHGLLTIKDPRGLQPLRNEYDNDGRLVRQIDAFGKEVRFTHDLNARQETTFDRFGRATVFDYDARGNVVRVQDADGKVTTRTYDARDNLLSETNALGKTVNYTYDAQDNRLSETDALGNKTQYTYNTRNQVLTSIDPAGGVTTYIYDANGNQTSVKDALGHTTGATYSANGLQLTSTDPLSHTTNFEYDASGNLTRQIDPLGNVTTHTYDANGNHLSESETRTVGGATETLVTSFEYDSLGRQTKVNYPDGSSTQTIYNSLGKQEATIDQLGRRTTYEYDAMGQLVRTTFPDATKESTEYDFEGRRAKTIDRAGRATAYAYDSLGRLTQITFPDATTNSNTYDATGQLATTTDALNHVTRYEYDAAGRRTKITDALGHETAFGYDVKGNQTSLTDAKGQLTRYLYDALNRRTQVVFPDNTTQATAYDSLGQVTSKTDQAGIQTVYEYDQRGKLKQVSDALGGVTSYSYDEQGNQLTQTDANHHTTTYAYDRMGRRTKRTLPLGMSETYAYNLAGNLTSRTDFRGKTTTFAHDLMNRVVSKTPDASLSAPAINFTYTATGQRQTMADASGTTTYTYSTRDRLVSKATPQGTLTYTHDGAGNIKSIRSSNANGVTVNYNYDELNRLSNVVDNNLSTGTTAYTYDLNGNLESTTYPNAVRTAYTFNSLNRLTNVNGAKGATLANYAYTLGTAGNRLSVTEANGRTVSYAYDALYRLTGESISNDTVAANNGALNYTYDAVGNRLNRTSSVGAIPATGATYDANDRLTSDAYDPNGNTTTSNANTYQYDSENRLTSLNGGAVTFVYDGDGNRVAKTVGGVTTRFLVDTNNHTGHAQVVEELVNASVRRTYTYGHDLISQTQLLNNIRTTHFYGYDGHGSTRYLTDASGAVTDTYTYDAFGNLIARTGTTPNDYLYAGEQYDANLGFYYLRARYMNSMSGRFHTQDSYEGGIKSPLSLHKYLYAAADPVNKDDPSGMFFTLAETSAANSIRSTLAQIQIMDGNALANQILYGGNSGIKSLAIDGGLIIAGGLFNKGIEVLGAAFKGIFGKTKPLRFSQVSASPRFDSRGYFPNKLIADVVKDLRTGKMSSAQVPVIFVERDNARLLFNTRSSVALKRAGIPEEQWTLVDKTGDAEIEYEMNKRLTRNGLDDDGIEQVRLGDKSPNPAAERWDEEPYNLSLLYD